MKVKALFPILLILAIATLIWVGPAMAKSDKANPGQGHEQDWGETPPTAVAAGKPEMLDPYGHSKDDRMELYGNRGRPVEPVIEPPPPPPEPPPEPPPVVEPPEPPPDPPPVVEPPEPPPDPPPVVEPPEPPAPGTTDPPPEPPATTTTTPTTDPAPVPDPVPEVPFQ